MILELYQTGRRMGRAVRRAGEVLKTFQNPRARTDLGNGAVTQRSAAEASENGGAVPLFPSERLPRRQAWAETRTSPTRSDSVADFDRDLILAVLPIEDRDCVARWLDVLGLPAASWTEVPPLSVLLPLLAARTLAADMPTLSKRDALRAAAGILGVDDDPDRDSGHCAGDRFSRTLRRWRAGADKLCGLCDQPRPDGAG